MERACRMSALRFIGGHDWYREGVQMLLASQNLSGSWPPDVEFKQVDDLHVSTSFSLMFLAKGRRPVVIAQLKHGSTNDWNRHRSSVFNLLSHVERVWKRDLTYQVVDFAAASVDDLLETPVLYLSGRDVLQFSTPEKNKLRDYLDRGGFLFAVQCCQGDDFDRSFRQLMAEVYPESENRLMPLSASHPVWFAEQSVLPKHLPELWGLETGCRTAVLYCPFDLSCRWELARTGREEKYSPAIREQIQAAKAIGLNILAYATNRELEYKNPAFTVTPKTESSDAFERGAVCLGNLVHPGGCHAAPAALGNLLKLLSDRYKLRFDTRQRDVSLSDASLFEFPLLFMHGRRAFHWNQQERQALRTYLERGGAMLADAICSSQEFADSFRRELNAVFPDQSLEPIPPNHPLFTSQFGGEDIPSVSMRTPRSGHERTTQSVAAHSAKPELAGLQLGDRYAVIFSPYDISCALQKSQSLECAGYSQLDAAKLAVNIVFYLMHN